MRAEHPQNEFTALRKRAKDKRDKGIAILRDEYERALAQIAALEQDLLGMRPANYRKIVDAVNAVIPKTAEFTMPDVMAGLEALDPRRAWRRRSVDWVIVRMRKRGTITRLKRANIHEPAVYVRSEAAPPKTGLDDMTLLEVIGKVLVRPMTTTEVVVAVLEAGYQTTMGRTHLRNHVTRLLNRGGFKQDAGKWVA
jgi:hypothetical protein